MQEQVQQVFQLNDLTGQEVEAIMIGLNELPSKTSRAVMNKLENQIIQQVQERAAMQALVKKPVPMSSEVQDVKAGRSD